MLRSAIQIGAIVCVSSVVQAGVVVELVPDNPGPYFGGESLTVDVWLQSEEEYGHGVRLLDFLLARDGTVKLQAIGEPRTKYKSIAAVFEEALEQEAETSRDIDKLYELAQKEKAFAALVQLQWFISEQVEEEKTAREIVAKFQQTKNDPAAIMDLDRELGARAPETPANAGG